VNEVIYVAGFGDIEFEVLKDAANRNGYNELVRIYSDHGDIK
jgi:hypothetical protein